MENYKLWFWTSLTNTVAGNKGKSKKLQGCPNYFLSKYDLLHLVTHENGIF
jgi:hypothetical protein